MTNKQSNSQGALKSFGERIERLDSEIKALNTDKAVVYSEAKSMGFDVKILKIAIRSKRELDENPDAVQERDSMVSIYLGSLLGQGGDEPLSTGFLVAGDSVLSPPYAHVHREGGNVVFETGEIIETQPLEIRTSKAAVGGGVGFVLHTAADNF
jgi:uncharacterized protein (UPF0335 family)